MSCGITPRIVTTPYKFTTIIDDAKRSEIAKKIWETRRKNGTDRHSEDTIRKLSEITTKNIASGKINRISKIEYIVADKLTAIGVNYIHQFGIRDVCTGRFNACVDFFLPDHNIAIEVNGTFWHADPRFYNPDNLTVAQTRTTTNYARKIDILHAADIRLVEIWEHDIKMSPDTFIDSLLNVLPKSIRRITHHGINAIV